MAGILQVSQPWTFLYRLGEMVREGQSALKLRIAVCAEKTRGPKGSRGDEQAASRMVEEGCPNT